MSDIVERLRGPSPLHWECKEAADEIERLRGGMLKMASTMSTQVETIERLRAGLSGLVGAVADHTSQKSIPDGLREARAALEEK